MLRFNRLVTSLWEANRAIVFVAVLLCALVNPLISKGANPVPQVNQPLVPASARPGDPGFTTLTVNGNGFVNGSVVNWNGSARATTFVSSTQLTAAILASDIATPGTALVTVVSPAPGGGKSNLSYFQIAAPATSVAFSRTDSPTGNTPVWVATGDFNGDGKLDLAVANSSDGTVSIFLGNGDGTFPTPAKQVLTTGGQPTQIITGDFNNDGNLDLAVSTASSSGIFIFLGSVNGTFSAATPPAVLVTAYGLAAGDFNGDGNLDLAYTTFTAGNTVSVLLGNGNGTFQTHVDYPVGAGPVGVTAGDFNGDGILDLAVANQNDDTVSILLGVGDVNGTFKAQVPYPTGSQPVEAYTADFNGDGRLDLVVPNALGNNVSILLGNGNGTFQGHQEYPTGSKPQSVALGDFNADGKLDLAVANQNDNTLSILRGKGDGTFQPKSDFTMGSLPIGVAAGDFNRDGMLDLAVTLSGINKISILSQIRGGANFLPPSLDLGVQNVGTTSAAQSIRLTNKGTGPLSISAIGASPSVFTETNDCPISPATLAVGAFCTIRVVFALTGDGTVVGSVTVTDDAAGSPQSVVLTAVGIGPAAVVPAGLAFAGQTVGTTSVSQTVTLTNNGTSQLNTGAVTVTGDFSETGNCASVPLSASQSCTLNVTFAPTAGGTRNGKVTIVASPPSSSQFTTITVSLMGTGLLTLNPTSLDFGNQLAGNASTAQVIHLTNSDPTTLTISNIAATGDYSQTNTCGSSVNSGSTCSISVTFTPTAIGTRTGTLSVTDNATGSPQTASLTGVGIGPFVNLSPTSLTFSSQAVGSASAAQMVTLSNTGTQPLTISSLTTNGDFAQTNNCPIGPATLAVNGFCTINVTFTPTATGNRTGAVTITDNAVGSPHNVNLTGSGVQAGVLLSPSTLNFHNVNVGASGSAQPVTLTNNGTSVLAIASIAATGDYSETDNCGTSVAIAANCTINVTFTPAAAGTRSGSLSITDNAATSPQTVSLTGVGIAPAVSLSSQSLTFANQTVNTTSAAQTVTLTNSGNASLAIASITPGGDFALATGTTCTSSSPVAANAHCTISVTFTPTATGSLAGAVTITDNAPGSPHVITLKGTGVVPIVSLSAATVTFPTNQLVGTTSAPQTETLSNTGTGPLTISSIVATGDFAQTNNCGSSVAATANCTISVTFTPTATGSRTGKITITDNNNAVPNSQQTVDLTGTSFQPVVAVSPSALNFGNQNVGANSAPQVLTLTNNGTGGLNISNLTASGDFSQTNNCGSSVAPAASCAINVTFTPSVPGNRSGSVTVTDDAPTSPQTVSLTGNGIAPAVSLSPQSLTFVTQQVGVRSAAQTVTLTNNGSASLSITSIVPSGDFAAGNNCGTSVAAGAICTISVTFTPTVIGNRTGAVTITDNATGSPHVVTLTGTGVVPIVSLSPSALSFPNQPSGTTSAPLTETLTNTGSGPLTILGIVATGDFAQTNTCGNSVAAGASCAINVTFAPTTTGLRSGTLTITDNASGSPHSVPLSGTGGVPVVTLTPTSLTFTGQLVGSPSAAQLVTLNNSGTAALVISNLTAAGDFTQTNTCGTGIVAGAHCTITVTFAPTAAGTRSGTVIVTDNAAGSPHSIALTGTGTAPVVSLSPITGLIFADTNLKTTTAAQVVTLSNTGDAALTITTVSITGTNSGDFAQRNTCGSSVAAVANCTINVTFTPTVLGAENATLTIADNATGSPQTLPLTGTGLGPVVSLSATSLSFGNQLDTTPSAAQTVTISNTGTAALNISNMVLSGPNSTEFAISATGTTCATASPVATGTSCTVNLVFTPTSAGLGGATLAITDNASGSPHTMALSGTGADFSGAPASNSSSSATVTAGGTATYILAFTGSAGLNGTAGLVCTGAPSLSICTINPTPVTLNGTTTVNATVTVTSTARSMLSPRGPIDSPTLWTPVFLFGLGVYRSLPLPAGLLALALLGGIASIAWLKRKELDIGPLSARTLDGMPLLVRARSLMSPRLGFATALLTIVILAAVSMPACGGGGGSPPPGGNPGTPAGTYNLTITATFTSGTATLTHNIPLSLTVN